jgi:hypothetical protein
MLHRVQQHLPRQKRKSLHLPIKRRLNSNQEENKMQAAKVLLMAASLLLLIVGTAAADWSSGDHGSRQAAEREVEAGGWQVAYGNRLTQGDVERGEVQPGVSIFAARGTREMGVLHEWANALVQQAANLATIRNLGQEDQFQAMRFTVRTVRELIRSRQPGSQQTDLSSVAIKAGLLEYRDRHERRSEVFFVPYVGMKAKLGGSVPWSTGPVQEPYNPYSPPVIQSPHQHGGPSSAEIMNAFALKNISRSIGGGSWQWVAYIDGPADFLRRISSVTYYLHPSFKPSIQYGDRSKPGHPLAATGWGVFNLKAEVALDDGTRRTYEHTLRFR